jgi:hypothetical protein
MKLKIGQKWYLQHYDVVSILNHADKVPEVVLNEIFKENSFVSGDNNLADTFKFDTVFTDSEAIRWLEEQWYIVDFEKMRCTKLQALEVNRDQLRVEHGQKYAPSGELTEEQKYEMSKLMHKIRSLDAGIDYRKHFLEFELPTR